MRPGKVLLLVLGVLITITGLTMATGGGLLIWAHTQRDTGGFYASGTVQLASPTAAIISDRIDLAAASGPTTRVIARLGTVRLSATGSGGHAVFLGIGRTADVQQYLNRCAYDQIASISRGGTAGHMTGPMGQRMSGMTSTMMRVNGQYAVRSPGAPGRLSFWADTAIGTRTQSLTWTPQPGDWTAVVMNADGAPGVAADASAGVRSEGLLAVAWSLLVGGIVVLAAGAGLVILGAHGLERPEPIEAGTAVEEAAPATASFPAGLDPRVPGAGPVRVHADLDPSPSRWLWLVKWLLTIPHAVVLAFLWAAVLIVTFVAGLVILVTGRYPRGLFDFTVGVLRWQWRVTYYALTLGTDRYPPFSLGAEPGYPARIDIDYPQQLSRPLVLVKWLLAIPQLLLVALFGAMAWTTSWNVPWWNGDARFGGGLGITGLLAVLAGFVLLFSGRYPAPVFNLILGLQRWTLRVAAYVLLLRDEYPPFRLDQGGSEPAVGRGLPPRPPRPASPARDDALTPV